MASILILNTALGPASAMLCQAPGAGQDRGASVSSQTSSEHQAPRAQKSAQTILQLARQTLDEAGLARADGVAVAAGPGSFTGVRIGVAVAQGLCAAWDVPAVPLSTLALSAAAAQRRRSVGVFLVGLKAWADQLYFGCYEAGNDSPIRHGAEQAGTLAQLRVAASAASLVAAPADQACFAVGDGWTDAAAIESHFGLRLAAEPFMAEVARADLLRLALAGWQRREWLSAEKLLPNYVGETPDYRQNPRKSPDHG